MKCSFFVSGNHLFDADCTQPQEGQIVYFNDLSRPLSNIIYKRKYKVSNIGLSIVKYNTSLSSFEYKTQDAASRLIEVEEHIKNKLYGMPNDLNVYNKTYSFTVCEAQVELEEVPIR